ncbi:isoleucine--tRNA ligase [Patescibacteria group bacterium]|nr:isoleucine--tRNA ligase [Patescibacteria group bacterium]
MQKKNKENIKSANLFPAMEEEVLNFWDKSKTFEKSVKKEAPHGPSNSAGKDYFFYDGPPFATGTPHYGHIVGNVMKDVVPRYWTMKGYRVERRWGWDCHGLPIENIVEKEMGSKAKKDIEDLGVDKFNELCRAKVLGYVDEWKKVIGRLGRWADMENSYKTMDLDFMESVWWVFKELYDKGLIYEGYRSMHVCPRCETTLSQSEVAEGYKDIKDLSCVVKFEIANPRQLDANLRQDDKVYVLAWTTTPWTLIGNVALAMGEKIDYVLAGIRNQELGIREYYILAKERVGEILKDKEYEIIKELKGKDLVGLEYKSLFDYYAKDEKSENRKNGWKIYPANFVTTEEGTGVVHIAPAFGEDDMNLGKKHNLPFIQHVGMDGVIKKEAGEFAGMSVKPADDHTKTDVEIIKYLAYKGLLFAKEKYEHSYPHCWRCETPLINYATSSWFVNIEKIKKQMLKTAKEISWSPKHIKEGRFGNWLESARDWSISRQRFWASVMPIWKCEKCGEMKVIGSVKELEKLSGEKITDIHKHIVDKITFKCEKCAGEMRRIPDVLDTWFDSGSMPYAQMHYPFDPDSISSQYSDNYGAGNKEKIVTLCPPKGFPAQFIAEGIDQTRCWFYYLHAIASGITGKPAYKNVIVNGIVLAEDGKKMAKKLNNYPDPMFVFDQYGADALRYYLLTSPVMLAENLNFSEKGVEEALRKVGMILWNVYKFYEMYAESPLTPLAKGGEVGSSALDKWINARLKQLIKEVTENMDNYNLPKATRPIGEFINDLSTWYLRRSRDRFKGDNEEDKNAALSTMKYVLIELAKVMAPFTPFIAEQLWQKVSGNDFKDENKSVHLESWPTVESGIMNQESGIITEMEGVRKIVELGLAKRDEAGIKVRQPLNKFSIFNFQFSIIEYEDLIKDELNIKDIKIEKDKGELRVELDTKITPELKQEGIKRELVRFINGLRKEAGMTIKDRAIVFYETDSDIIKKAVDKYAKEIMNDTLSEDIVFGFNGEAAKGAEFEKEVKIEGETVKLGIRIVSLDKGGK